MDIDPLLQELPTLIKNQPQLFSTVVLCDLEKLLASVEDEPLETAEEKLIDWCIERELRDALRKLSEKDKAEVKKVKPSEPNDSKRTINFFQELSQQVKDKLEQQNQSQHKQ